MRINPILNNYNSNSSFKGSIDKSLVNYIKSAEKQQTVRLKPAKDCDKFLGLMEQFMKETSDSTILTTEKAGICKTTGLQLYRLFFKDTKTGVKIAADDFVFLADKISETKNENTLTHLTDDLLLYKNDGKCDSFASMMLDIWARLINRFSSPKEVDLALKAVK